MIWTLSSFRIFIEEVYTQFIASTHFNYLSTCSAISALHQKFVQKYWAFYFKKIRTLNVDSSKM